MSTVGLSKSLIGKTEAGCGGSCLQCQLSQDSHEFEANMGL